jgi:hypothetical protein
LDSDLLILSRRLFTEDFFLLLMVLIPELDGVLAGGGGGIDDVPLVVDTSEDVRRGALPLVFRCQQISPPLISCFFSIVFGDFFFRNDGDRFTVL